MIRKTTETGGVGRVKLLRISGRVLKIERSLTEARKNHLIIQSYCSSRIPVNPHYKLWYSFLYFEYLNLKSVTLLILCLVFAIFSPLFLSGLKMKYSIKLEYDFI